MKILLGSNSPRRKELLQNLGFDFEVVSINCDEIYPENLEVEKIASFLSELKANAFRKIEKDEILLTADTVVTFENKVLGKPKNREEAVEMLLIYLEKHIKFTPEFLLKLQKISSPKQMLQK
jgi:septum formation protein